MPIVTCVGSNMTDMISYCKRAPGPGETIVGDKMVLGLRQVVGDFDFDFPTESDDSLRKAAPALHLPRRVCRNLVDDDLHQFSRLCIYSCGFPCQPFNSAAHGPDSHDKCGELF